MPIFAPDKAIAMTKQNNNRNVNDEGESFYLKASDIIFDLGKLVFGGVLIGGLFESVENRFLLYTAGFIIFFLFMVFGYILFKIGNNKKRK